MRRFRAIHAHALGALFGIDTNNNLWISDADGKFCEIAPPTTYGIEQITTSDLRVFVTDFRGHIFQAAIAHIEDGQWCEISV